MNSTNRAACEAAAPALERRVRQRPSVSLVRSTSVCRAPVPAPHCTRARLGLALLGACALAGAAAAQPQGAGEPVVVEAERIEARPDRDAVASGDVQLRRGAVTIRADRITYAQPEGRARAVGDVRITRDGDRFSGAELDLRLDSFEGHFLLPEYFFARTQAGGRAERIDFFGRQRSRLTGADYTSCDREGNGAPDWLLSARRVDLDFENNEGVAEGAVLRFLGVPILALPALSFPVTDERKSGWLPPNLNIDSRSGIEIGVPYYWNIAPQYDATLTPTVYTRRGVGLGGEFRYLDPRFAGIVRGHALPGDDVYGRARSALALQHAGVLDGWHHRVDLQRVSDDDYWKDFGRDGERFTPRLLPRELDLRRLFDAVGRHWEVYGGTQRWQVLQDRDPSARIVAPYQRELQLGLRGLGPVGAGVEYDLEGEYNRFTRPPGSGDALVTGERVHLLGSLSLPLRASYGWLTPRLALNAASYRTDQPMDDARTRATRVVPTLSVDGGLVFERDVRWLGRDLRQTLEPRVVYANTPYRDQSALPLFDAAPKDFNEVSIYSDNAFSGIDRVADAHQVTAGVATRFFERASGVELMRFALVQRYLLSDQLISAEGEPLTQRVSDLLLSGSAWVAPGLAVDVSARYSPSIDRTMRSVIGAHYTPGPFRALSARYSFARGLAEQLELGWQWPVFGGPERGARASGDACRGSLYAVGRVNYSLRDSRLTDSLFGVEYDKGCWIARVVAERLSTGRSEATTRMTLQLELVGLSRLGSNALRVLKDNIPGYRMLREASPLAPPDPVAYE